MDEPDIMAKFNLKWNSYSKVLTESVSNLLATGQYSDVILACEGQTIKCHRFVLSTFSQHLAGVLDEITSPQPIIYLGNGIKFNHLQTLLKFMYNGEAEISQLELPEVLKAAEELKVKGLTVPRDTATAGLGNIKQNVDVEDETEPGASIPGPGPASGSTSLNPPMRAASPSRFSHVGSTIRDDLVTEIDAEAADGASGAVITDPLDLVRLNYSEW